uniref:NADH-ubiquinone oxidoreductase chain 2 n=1 Tax=Lepidogalaxias salamandroides TaxID=89578 RepID=F1AWF1_9TELE|nr:NADH dehydrogenase subunit 2 [Lepidogalaxias salamandroides]
MNPNVLTVFLLSLGLGTTLTFTSSHWLLAWMGLEINSLAIIPLMTKNLHPRAMEAATKYFLTQATAAAILLFAAVLNAWLFGEWNIQHSPNQVISTLVALALMLKLGLAPLHFWLPEVLQGLDLTTGLILSTWQKLAPFALIIQMAPMINPAFLTMMGLTSILVGGWGGLNQTQLRKILAYSSIAHLGWMIIVLQFTPWLAMLNMVIYIIISIPLFLTLKTMSSTSINTLSLSQIKLPILINMMTLLLLSLGGLPPLSGFMPKWLILHELTKQNLPTPATIAAMASLISLFFYLRLCYAATLTMSPSTIFMKITPWHLAQHKKTLALAISITLATLLLPITSSITAFTL